MNGFEWMLVGGAAAIFLLWLKIVTTKTYF